MKLVKHATNKEISESIILQCPYCDYKLPFSAYNQTRLLTHIRVQHIKYQFPPETEFTLDTSREDEFGLCKGCKNKPNECTCGNTAQNEMEEPKEW